MGCNETKAMNIERATESKSKKSKKDSAPTSADDDAPIDPRLPLTARQVFKLQKTWKAIKRNMQMAGVEMFLG